MVKKVQKEYLTSKSDCSGLRLFFYCFLSLFQVGASWRLKQSPPPQWKTGKEMTRIQQGALSPFNSVTNKGIKKMAWPLKCIKKSFPFEWNKIFRLPLLDWWLVRLGNFRYTVPGDQEEMETTYSEASPKHFPSLLNWRRWTSQTSQNGWCSGYTLTKHIHH